MVAKTLTSVVAEFGAAVKAKLSNAAIQGAPEDQLRGPLETLLRELAETLGLVAGELQLVGETSLRHLQVRPDFAVSVNNALVGFIEVKAPGKGFDPRRFSDPHDKAQWAKFKSLPNLLYTDGNGFSLWRNGEPAAKAVAFEGDIEISGAKLRAPDTLSALLSDYFNWKPQPPANAKRLAEVSARLCRLLRDEVVEQMAQGQASLLSLREDWRKLLFPNADDAQFADGYAQAVTFGLLMARAFEIPLDEGVELAALRLKKSNSLIGTALNLLTEDAASQEALKTSLGTLLRVLNEVNWAAISKDKPESWLYFYEDFLEVYDNRLRKLTGSYYTPPEVVSAMTRLVDEALRGPLFDRASGLASADVTIADPAVGTGTFLLGALRKIAQITRDDTARGDGMVAGAVTAAAKRMFGFELQFGPFAVAQLRILAEVRALTKPKESSKSKSVTAPEINLFITDTLSNPFIEEEHLPHIVEAVAKSRRDANRVKRGQPITVVIGNPPYKNKAAGMGGWIESGAGGKLAAPLDRWKPPQEWGAAAHTHHLKNLYVYFWRWATLKVFGAGRYAATGEPDQAEEGIVCFITVAGFLNGPGFQKMRDDLRRTCSAIWVIDCSADGHQPDVPTRIFQAVQQPICIVLAARTLGKDSKKPAAVRFYALPKGSRQDKFAALANLSLDQNRWATCSDDWRAPFLPRSSGDWASYLALGCLFAWSGSGVTPHRRWPIAVDPQSLTQRWDALRHEPDMIRKEELFQPDRDRSTNKTVTIDLGRHKTRPIKIRADKQPIVPPVRYAFRSFDRQWIIPDCRLLSMPRPRLWNGLSAQQVYSTALEAHSPRSGPAVTFTAFIPDLDQYNGRGGRVYPLWADAAATIPNIRPELLSLLAEVYGVAVSPEDALAYIAAVMAHPAFTARFADDLKQPGLRLPLTADAALFSEAVAVGREVVWLHCYGERFADPLAHRPKGAPRMAKDGPRIPADGAIPPAPEPLPDTMTYEPEKRRLHVGKGFIDNVSPEMWAYEVSGKQVVWHWFSYRRRDRSKPIIGDRRPPSALEHIQPEGWMHEYTTDLLDLLHVLGRLVALEPTQADLLGRICEGQLIEPARLIAAGLREAEAGGEDENA